MGGLEFDEKKIKHDKIQYPEIDTSYAFRPHNRQPKLIRAIIEQQPPLKLTASELAIVDIQTKLSVHLQELESLYAFHGAAKEATQPPKLNKEEIRKLADFKAIRACIHKKWHYNSIILSQEQDIMHWTHEDTLAETKYLMATRNFVSERS